MVRLHVGYLGIPAIFQLVCQVFHSITFAFSSYSRSAVEARNCQIGQIGKIKTASDIKSENPLVFFAKTENQTLKNGKSANRNEHQNRKSDVFGVETEKTDLKNSQNYRTEYPNAPLLNGIS